MMPFVELTGLASAKDPLRVMVDPAINTSDNADEWHEETGPLKATSLFRLLNTTLAHQIFLLVSTAFFLFECMFLWFYSERTWFGLNLIPFSIPAALLTMTCAHFMLQWSESPAGCDAWALIFKGMPPAAYRVWVRVNEPGFEPGIRFGNRRALWAAIDSAELTFFGNLLLKSRSSSGPSVIRTDKGKPRDLNPPQLLFKVPFGVASRRSQIELIALLKNENSNCRLNSRLEKQVAKDEPKGSLMILNIVSACFVLFFVDVAYSTFSYLEMLKEYTLAKEGNDAKSHFQRAEDLRLHPLPISWVTRKMFQTPSTKAGVMQIRADALWAMNRRDDAIASMQDALEEHTKNFRAELKLARLLVECGKFDEAYKVLDKATEKSKKTLVPRMYYLALLQAGKAGPHGTPEKFYNQSMTDLDEELFKDNSGWPPGVSPYSPDVWHRDDVEFVFKRMMNSK